MKESGKKQVAAYVRVSTAQELQLHSLQNQRDYYIRKISENPDWHFAGIFMDEGISGTGLSRRTGIRKLVALSQAHQIDLIFTKSISRFARNVTDLLALTRQLKAYGTEVIFEKENLSSLSPDGELMLSLMGVFAQTESESISSNIKWRIQKDRENGIPTAHFNVLGYRWSANSLVIEPTEAEVVKEIYRRYEEGCSAASIARSLNERILSGGAPELPASRRFDASSVRYILRNPIYCGDLLMGKFYSTSPINGRTVKNRGERPMYLVENNHEPIIDRLRWNRIQEIIKARAAGNGRCLSVPKSNAAL